MSRSRQRRRAANTKGSIRFSSGAKHRRLTRSRTRAVTGKQGSDWRAPSEPRNEKLEPVRAADEAERIERERELAAVKIHNERIAHEVQSRVALGIANQLHEQQRDNRKDDERPHPAEVEKRFRDRC